MDNKGADSICDVLIVDDDAIMGRLLTEIVTMNGKRPLGPADSLSSAQALVATSWPDMALLDIELGDVMVWPLAEELLARGIPFAFVSGVCARGDLPEPFASMECLPKPASLEAIMQVLDRMEKQIGLPEGSSAS